MKGQKDRKKNRDRKIGVVNFRNCDPVAIFFLKQDRRSPRDRGKRIADRDQKIGNRSCLASQKPHIVPLHLCLNKVHLIIITLITDRFYFQALMIPSGP